MGEVVASVSDDRASGGLAALGAAIMAAGIGAFIAAGAVLSVAFRAQSGRSRSVTLATTVILGPGRSSPSP